MDEQNPTSLAAASDQNNQNKTQSMARAATGNTENLNDPRSGWYLVGGNSHYANDRSALTTYHHAPRQGSNSIDPDSLGSGTVELELVRSPEDPRAYPLDLENVLHLPTAHCNAISHNLLKDHIIMIDWSGFMALDAHTKEPAFYGTRYQDLLRAVLAEHPQDEQYLEGARHSMLSVFASREGLEKLRQQAEDSDSE